MSTTTSTRNLITEAREALTAMELDFASERGADWGEHDWEALIAAPAGNSAKSSTLRIYSSDTECELTISAWRSGMPTGEEVRLLNPTPKMLASTIALMHAGA